MVEISLNSINFGTDYTTFVKISDQFENYKFFNPKLPQKYFGNTPITPSVIPDGFAKNKKEDTFRIFVLGGSTTAGFPHSPNGSFPRLLKNMLKDEYPKTNFEVINLGISAVNTITIRDIIDDVIQEEPDLIVLYTGHNEYYGALGPSSNISSYYNLWLARLLLDLKNFKTVQLVEDLISAIIDSFKGENRSNKTLMSKIAGQNLVPLNSEEYDKGTAQFKENISYILSVCHEYKIPTLIGTLASNLMQEPLCKYSGCDDLVKDFSSVISQLDEDSRAKLYSIKDKDELRFRAPEEFNQIISEQAKSSKSKIFDVQGAFEEYSLKNIIGSSLMMDHLHPTLNGNMIIAKIIMDEIIRSKLISQSINNEINRFNLNNELLSLDSYTELDSTFAYLRIQHLKNDFPFSKLSENSGTFIFHPNNLVDSIAYAIINGGISWENAHLKLANYYLEKGDFQKYSNEMNVLIEDKPFDKFAYLTAIEKLDKAKQYSLQIYFLNKYHNYFQDYYSSQKLGHVYYLLKNFGAAKYFYEKSLTFSNNDPEVYFNLSAINFADKNLQEAFENIKKCLSLNPEYPNARRIFDGLQ